MFIPLSKPSPNESPESFRFHFYLSSLTGAAREVKRLGDHTKMAGLIACSPAFTKLQNPKCSLDGAEALLRNSWFTEEQLSQPFKSGIDDLIGYANHWAPVQLYYCVHLAWRCFIVTSGETVPEKHSSTLNHAASKIFSSPALFLPPWCYTLMGNPEIDSTLVLTPTAGCCTEVAVALKSTRQKLLDETVDEYKAKTKKPDGSLYSRIPPKAKSEIVRNLDRTSFFNFLYRLRILSNYESADLFLNAMNTPHRAKIFNTEIRNLADGILFNLELLIAKRIGKKAFLEWASNFDRMIPKKHSATRRHDRLDAINGAY